MQANVGGLDKVVRIIAGVILIALAATGTIGIWGWIGILPLVTGIFNFCPAYRLLGISSCKIR